jgi:ATP-dependent exoDNAse (exonuclease V) beta subunit
MAYHSITDWLGFSRSGNTPPTTRLIRSIENCALAPSSWWATPSRRYRFRGADVNAYIAARQAIDSQDLLEITANFRSLGAILDLVNGRFSGALAKEHGQPGFTDLDATVESPDEAIAVAALDIVTDEDDQGANALRDAEAKRVAELCRRLIGHWNVRDPDNRDLRPCRAGDIALLAPVGTELWPFEAALEDEGIPVSTQAGKGFFNRQEIQDLIALTRAIADARDTLALRALLRGPLVGLTETELLDIAESLPTPPERPDKLVQLNLWTPPRVLQRPRGSDMRR